MNEAAPSWFARLKQSLTPFPRWPLRVTGVTGCFALWMAIQADIWTYLGWANVNSDVVFLGIMFLWLGVWQFVRVVNPLLSRQKRVVRTAVAVVDVGGAWLCIYLTRWLVLVVFAAHVALFHPCSKFKPQTRLGVCLDRDSGLHGTFVMYDRDNEFLKPEKLRSPAWRLKFSELINHDLSACRVRARLAPHIFLVDC